MPSNFEDYKERVVDYIKRVFAVDFNDADWKIAIKTSGVSLDYKIRPEFWCILPFALMDDKISWESAIKEDIEVNINEARLKLVRIEKEIRDLQLQANLAKDYLYKLIDNK